MSNAEDVTDLVRSDGRVRPIRPDFAFMRQRLSRWVALGCGSGLSSVAPGTFGTLFGWAVYAALVPLVGPAGMLALAALGFVLGLWAIDRTTRDLGVADHGAIVSDEVIAIWCVLAFVGTSFTAQLVGVLLFRFFDVVKPPPVHLIDRRWKSALGVMADDLMAAVYALLVVALWQRVFGG